MRGRRVLAALLAIGLFDELAFGVLDAALPLIRDDLGLSYVQLGLLTAAGTVSSALLEPLIGVLGDTRLRRALVLGGGTAFATALVLAALAPGFWTLALAYVLLFPASGAFVSLSQASLMDLAPERREPNMARWELIGTIGVLAGPLLLAAAVLAGAGWRGAVLLLAVTALLLAVAVRRVPFAGSAERFSLRGVLAAARTGKALRWLVLLESADLLGDVFAAFLALYFVDEAGLAPAAAGAALALWAAAGLAGSAIVLLALRRFSGIVYVRLGALASIVLFPTLLLAPSIVVKLAAVAALGVVTSGWYAVLNARLYAALEGRSGTVTALSSLANLPGAAVVVAIGLAADRFGLDVALWLLLAGPFVLLAGLRRRR
ncbi:MAG TPA: MFS transporter [Gaiellaceae bacterium]|nr:MFS transporter [Gaiellaceae bacterium]